MLAPAPLGVGCSLLPSHLSLLEDVRDLVGVVEISPDMYCQEVLQPDGSLRMRLVPSLVEPVLSAIGGLPVVVHGLELSIGSASGWNASYFDMLDEFDRRRSFCWHSEHIGFLNVGDRHAGIPLPMPFTREAAELVARRANCISRRYGRVFLLENSAYYIADLPRDPGWDEATFLAAIARASDCGLLLDLFNLYVNCVNHELDAYEMLARLPLERVIEIHVAGGDHELGYLLDSHSAVVPEEVWRLVVWVLERAPNVAALIFEVLEQSLPRLGASAYVEEIARAADVWKLSRRASR